MASSHQVQEQESQVVVEQDQFNRLPDDLVMLVINKLFHVKTLIRFSLVSKRYSSLVFQTDSLFVDLETIDTGFLGRLVGFLKNLVAKFTRASTPDIPSCNTQKMSVMAKDFQQTKHLHLHLRGNPDAGFLWKRNCFFKRWVAGFGSSFEFFLFLVASSVNQSNCSSYVASSSNYNLHDYYGQHLQSLLDLVILMLKDLRTRHDIIKNFILKLDHKMLESVVFSDDDTGGNFVMHKEQIAKLRNNQEVSAYPADLCVSVNHFPTLHLPESGCTMNDVIIVSAIPADQDVVILEGMDTEEKINILDDSILHRWDVFDEALRQTVNESEDRMPMYVINVPCDVLQ